MTQKLMQAIVCESYGSPDVLQLKEVPRPSPRENQILIKISATTVTAADSMMRKGSPWIGRLYLGLFKPKRSIPGAEFSGVVEAVGSQVSNFQVGDEVFGETLDLGCYAEYVCVGEDEVVLSKPKSISHEQAAALGGTGITVMNFLCDQISLQAGQKILVIGASGALGTYAVQVAKHMGAEVTGVCSARNHVLVKSLGADHLIDYNQTDYSQEAIKYDVVFDTVGKSSFAKARKALKPKGVFLSPVLDFCNLFRMFLGSFGNGPKGKFSATGMLSVEQRLPLLEKLRNMVSSGAVKTVIDQACDLKEVVAAHRYVDTGRKKGNLIVHPSSNWA